MLKFNWEGVESIFRFVSDLYKGITCYAVFCARLLQHTMILQVVLVFCDEQTEINALSQPRTKQQLLHSTWSARESC